MTARRWILEDPGRPKTMNDYRTLHFQRRAAYDREVRERFGWLARQARIPHLDAITVTAHPVCRHKPIPDVGACYPAAKAAIDGLVDVGVIPDDCEPYVELLAFAPPTIGDRDALILVIEERPIAA